MPAEVWAAIFGPPSEPPSARAFQRLLMPGALGGHACPLLQHLLWENKRCLGAAVEALLGEPGYCFGLLVNWAVL